MNVMMIGHANSGKTTYMAAMYKKMYEGIQGYSIESNNLKNHNDLMTINNRLLQGYYPGSTDIHSEYKFKLLYNKKALIDFNWFDYRGGALIQESNSLSDVVVLNRKIKESDALIVFLDGDKMTKNDPILQKELRLLISRIRHSVKELDKNTSFPISFVVTKGRRFENNNLFETVGYLSIKNLIEEIKQSENINGLLTVTEINKNAMLNIEFPFLFSMQNGILNLRNKAVVEHDECLVQANNNTSDANLFDDVFCFFSGHKTSRELANEKLSRVKKMKEEIEYLASNCGKIKTILDKVNSEKIHLF